MTKSMNFSIPSFLRKKEALLVHFNTPMSTNHPTCFPHDLRDAKRQPNLELSCSTILSTDHGPNQTKDPATANAGGSVGLVIKPVSNASVSSVWWQDSGSSQNGSAGSAPTKVECERSLALRQTSNEWRVKNYTSLGIFVFLPAMVFVKSADAQGEVEIDLRQIIQNFPVERIFSALEGSFVEYDRASSRWGVITYDDIVLADEEQTISAKDD